MKHILLPALMLVFAASCNILDYEPKGSLTTDLVLSSVEGIEGSILGVYERARSPFESNDLFVYETAGTDLMNGGTNIGDQRIVEALASYNSNLNPDNTGIQDLWNAFYTGLNRANIIISKIDQVEGADNPLLVDRINTVKGEAYFFRAYFHFQLLKKFENIVLVLEAPETITLEASLSSPTEVIAAVIADLETAKDLLPDKVPGPGKASSATANHLLAKAYMWAGDTQKAAVAAEAALANPNYALAPLSEIFSTEHEGNSEILLAWVFDQSDPDHPSRTCQQWIPLYDRVNGVARSFAQGGRPWSRCSPSQYYWSLFDSDGDGDLDDESDRRLTTWHKLHWTFDDPDNIPDGFNVGDVVTVENIGSTNPRYIERTTFKYHEDAALGRQIGDAQGYKDVIQYRLAETYLIAAEAHMKNGNMSRALELVNALRERAYGNASHNFTTLNMDTYLEEHARELGHEGVRLEILQREGILYERAKLYNPLAAAAMQPYHVRWPIPRSFTSTTGVPQNEGYN